MDTVGVASVFPKLVPCRVTMFAAEAAVFSYSTTPALNTGESKENKPNPVPELLEISISTATLAPPYEGDKQDTPEVDVHEVVSQAAEAMTVVLV
jgi:hypothetical protein